VDPRVIYRRRRMLPGWHAVNALHDPLCAVIYKTSVRHRTRWKHCHPLASFQWLKASTHEKSSVPCPVVTLNPSRGCVVQSTMIEMDWDVTPKLGLSL
jgi:hypothetical protein